MHYIIESVGNETGLCGGLINLDQSKTCNRIDDQYMETVVKGAGFFHGC